MSQDEAKSIQSIRWRLLRLLLRAFGIVVFLTVIMILVVAAIVILRNTGTNPFFRNPTAIILESYYLGHGSWQGVEAILNENTAITIRSLRPDWNRAILVDENGVMVIDHGSTQTPNIGIRFFPSNNETSQPLVVNGAVIGTLWIDRGTSPRVFQLIGTVIGPTAFISIWLGILTLVIGILLMRRMINPLSEVIAAAQAVTQGDLSARVPVGGQDDDMTALSIHFNDMADELERADQQRRNMLADIAHELRTPLTILRGRLEGILDGVYAADDQNIAPALEETYLLERLVEDLRLLALADAKQLQLDTKPTNLAELAETILGLFTAQAAERDVRLKLEAEPDLPLVQVDPQRFQQVIGNLIDNALRYTPANSSVDISIVSRQDEVTLTVSDWGPGIPDENLVHVFDRFWRGDRSRARATGGTGLGLSIARQLVEAQGGKIIARNRSPHGFEVVISLPISILP